MDGGNDGEFSVLLGIFLWMVLPVALVTYLFWFG